MARLAVLTGATGFLGRHVARALVADGWRIRLLSRRELADPLWSALGAEVVRGDLLDAEGLRRLCRGARAVVHAAGLVKARSASAFEAVNAAGARAVATAARDAAPEAAFVLVSSLAARGPHLSAYAASKRGGELAVTEVLEGGAWTVRLPALYGPEDRQTLPLFRMAAASPVLPVLGPAVRVPFLHVEDAARALAALAAREGSGRLLALSDARPQGYGLAEVMAAAAAAVQASPRNVRVPSAAVRLLGRLGDLSWRLGGSPIMTSGKVRELFHPDWSVSPEEREPDLPDARFGLADGFRDTVAWYRAAGWLDRAAPIAV